MSSQGIKRSLLLYFSLDVTQHIREQMRGESCMRARTPPLTLSYKSGLAYFTDVGHYLIWVYLSYDSETCITDQPFGRAV